MGTIEEDLDEIEQSVLELAKIGETPEYRASLKKIEAAVEEASRAFSGSCSGYHANVYYKHLEPPPLQARFDSVGGLQSVRTRGDWEEVDPAKLISYLVDSAGDPSFSMIKEASKKVIRECGELCDELVSICELLLISGSDPVIHRLKTTLAELEPTPGDDLIEHLMVGLKDEGDLDSRACHEERQYPPHLIVQARVDRILSEFEFPSLIVRHFQQLRKHLLRKGSLTRSKPMGTKIFIGHGRSPAWRELKDYVQEQLGLQVDEFNRQPSAGLSVVERLEQMLDQAAFAFLVLTAEDETSDGKMNARLNVIHEVGLFQGKLGFKHAIILKEDGCEEFSNVIGLGQIRFPKDSIKAAFAEVRSVLELRKVL